MYKMNKTDLISFVENLKENLGRVTEENKNLREAMSLVLICHEPDKPSCGCDLEGPCAWHHAYGLVKDEYLDMVE